MRERINIETGFRNHKSIMLGKEKQTSIDRARPREMPNNLNFFRFNLFKILTVLPENAEL